MAKKMLTENDVTLLSEEFEEIKETEKTIKKRREEIKATIFSFFDNKVGANKEAEVVAKNGFKFTREKRGGPTLDESLLKEIIGDDVWKKITIVKRELDEKKFKAALESGTITKAMIKKATKDNSSFSFNHRKISEEK